MLFNLPNDSGFIPIDVDADIDLEEPPEVDDADDKEEDEEAEEADEALPVDGTANGSIDMTGFPSLPTPDG